MTGSSQMARRLFGKAGLGPDDVAVGAQHAGEGLVAPLDRVEVVVRLVDEHHRPGAGRIGRLRHDGLKQRVGLLLGRRVACREQDAQAQ